MQFIVSLLTTAIVIVIILLPFVKRMKYVKYMIVWKLNRIFGKGTEGENGEDEVK